MGTLEIRDLDRSDLDEVRAYWQLCHDALAERRFNTFPAWQAARVYMTQSRRDCARVDALAYDDGELVAASYLYLPLLDNTHLAWTEVWVRGDRRREGLGTRLAAHTESRAREQGRRVLLTEAYAPVGAESAATCFARSLSYADTLEDGVKVADLRETAPLWPALSAEAAAHHAGHRLVTVWDALPGWLVDGFCRLNEAFVDLAPQSDDSEVETERWDEQRVRELETQARLAGRHDVRTFALTSDGTVVGMTEALINEHVPHRAFQGGTLVLPDHRGHRLGLAMKAANHAALTERFPQAEWIVSSNADVNAAMNAINERLGFRVVERCVEMQKGL